jgi:hypothetical protein
MQWFATEPHGRVARREATSLAKALQHELIAWDARQRNPLEISQQWAATLHAPRVATAILNKVSEQKSSGRLSDALRLPPKTDTAIL